MDQGQATSKKRKRPVLITAALLAAVAAAVYFGAKWSYANAVSAHTDRLELAELARSLSPSDPQTNYAVGVLLDDTFDPSSVAGSVAAFKSAVDAGPHIFLLWLRYAQALERSGDRTAARDLYEKALALAPNYAEVQWAYGNFLIRNGESDAGFAYAAKAAAAAASIVPPSGAAVAAVAVYAVASAGRRGATPFALALAGAAVTAAASSITLGVLLTLIPTLVMTRKYLKV